MPSHIRLRLPSGVPTKLAETSKPRARPALGPARTVAAPRTPRGGVRAVLLVSDPLPYPCDLFSDLLTDSIEEWCVLRRRGAERPKGKSVAGSSPVAAPRQGRARPRLCVRELKLVGLLFEADTSARRLVRLVTSAPLRITMLECCRRACGPLASGLPPRCGNSVSACAAAQCL